MKKHFDLGNLIVILITFLLFVVALFVKGITKDLLLEAGVLLVSVKLIMTAYRTGQFYKELKNDMEEIKSLIKDQAGKTD